MGNSNCKACIKETAQNEFDFRAERRKNRQMNDHVVLIQSVFRAHHSRNKRINKAFRNSQYHDFKFQENWDNYFKSSAKDVDFSLNGIQNLKNAIFEFYNDFFKLPNIENMTIDKKLLTTIGDAEDFKQKLKPVIIKHLANNFSFCEIEKKINAFNFSFEAIENLIRTNNANNSKNGKEISNKSIKVVDSTNPASPIYPQPLSRNKSNKVVSDKNVNLKNVNFNSENDKVVQISERQDLNQSSGSERILKIFDFSSKTNTDKTNAATNISKEEENNGNTNNNSLFKSLRSFLFKNKKPNVKSSSDTEDETNQKSSLTKAESVIKKSFCIGQNTSQLNKIALFDNSEGVLTTFIAMTLNLIEKEKKNIKVVKFMDFKTGTYYEGGWHRLKQCKYGLGLIYMTDAKKGSRFKYLGYFKDGSYDGFGMYVNEEGYCYSGEFREGLPSGFGFEKSKMGTYKGFFSKGKYDGFGESWNQTKTSLYCGNYCNGLKEGLGFATLSDNSKFVGQYKNNKMNGLGLFEWPQSHKYYGNWVNDRMQGLGHYVWSKGDQFVGIYENDLRHGEGEYMFKNGAMLKGTWRHSKKEGKFLLVEAKAKHTIFYRNDVQID